MPEPTREHLVSPPWAFLGIFALVAIALGGAAAGRANNAGAVMQNGTVVTQRDLLFEDRSDGAVVVRDAAARRPIEVFEGENGFVRGTLRGFARTRHSEHVGQEIPFRLAMWSDGRLTLDDPATGRHVELLAFGPSNASVFAKLLAAAPL